MDSNKKILELLAEQKNITSKYEKLIEDLADNEEFNQVNKLKDQLENLDAEFKELEKKYLDQVNDNLALKNSLMEQIFNEKMAILNASKRKIGIYFDDLEKEGKNKLARLEANSKKRIKQAMELLDEELKEEYKDIWTRLNSIEKEIEELVDEKKKILEEEKSNVLSDVKREYEELRNERIDEALIKKKKKENDIEVKIGLNLINKIAIVLLLLGLATGMRYTYVNWFNLYMKSIVGFAFGVLLLGLGEWLNRKEKNIFALGLSGGGIGALYLAVFNSYFILGSLGIYTALLVSLLVTAISILLANRYESQTISSLSLIGGYLPFFSYVFAEGLNVGETYIAMAYLLILNLTILILSREKRWIFVKYLSFGLNILTSIFLISNVYNDILSIFYSLLIFIMYLSIVLYKPINENIRLKISEIVLLGLNTVINFSIVLALFYSLAWDDFNGFLALVYGVVYYLIGRFISKRSVDLRKTADLFYLTALSFAVIMIPFQFGIRWLSLGWLVESVLLIHFFKTKYKDEKKMEMAGWLIFILCLGSFMVFDFTYSFASNFIFKYTAITVSLIYILKLYLPEINKSLVAKGDNRRSLLNIYKYFVIVFSWIFLLRISFILYEDLIDIGLMYSSFFIPVIFALVTGIYAYVISNIKGLRDRVVDIMSTVLYILIALVCLQLSGSDYSYFESTSIRVLSVIILIAYNIFVFLSIKSLVFKLIRYKKLTPEILPLSMAIYLLGVIPLFLLNQFDLSNINLIISIIFVVLSLIYILYGFKEKYILIRRFGLLLSMFATAKLFILDLRFLNSLGRIIAYLAFGLTLLGISFAYQRLKTMTEEG